MATPLTPKAFRIRHFRSIVDSGECQLSGDRITVLAGQNEAGKTAVLTALRDFDQAEGDPPLTPEYQPDGQFDVEPSVWVMFHVDINTLTRDLQSDKKLLPESLCAHLRTHPSIWIERRLRAGKFHVPEELNKFWPVAPEVQEDVAPVPTTPKAHLVQSTLVDFPSLGSTLRGYWPLFVYFESFKDTLPKEIIFDDVALEKPVGSTTFRENAPRPVRDFVQLSGVDLNRIKSLSDQDKALGNYLEGRSAHITGDFLTYWQQKTEGKDAIDLHIKHLRDQQGSLKLAFFVRDGNVDQYPEQRSQGFLWFLSFYLRLAAAEQDTDSIDQLLLIDEPGTYLHARAQRDVLRLFEDRVTRRQQIVYSTHSPFLLPPDKIHRVRVVLKKGGRGTKVLDRLTHPDLQGQEFTDTLSPIIAAIGMDVQQTIGSAKPNNLLVEGVTDLMYLHAWSKLLKFTGFDNINIFPGTGALSLLTFSGLFIGWGMRFAVLLDRDKKGEDVKEKLQRNYNLPERAVVQPKQASSIEDVFSPEDFRTLLQSLDDKYTIHQGETPSKAVKRQNVDKVLLARKHSEEVNRGSVQITRRTQDAIHRLFQDIETAMNV